MMNMLQQMMQQQQELTPEEELLRHQKPIASAQRTLLDILEYTRRSIPQDIFTELVTSLQENLNTQLDKMKMTAIPNASDIVSINGQPVK